MKDEVVEVKVGQVLLTTGYKLLDAHRMTPYGYGKFSDVYSSLEFE